MLDFDRIILKKMIVSIKCWIISYAIFLKDINSGKIFIEGKIKVAIYSTGFHYS